MILLCCYFSYLFMYRSFCFNALKHDLSTMFTFFFFKHLFNLYYYSCQVVHKRIHTNKLLLLRILMKCLTKSFPLFQVMICRCGSSYYNPVIYKPNCVYAHLEKSFDLGLTKWCYPNVWFDNYFHMTK